MIDPVRLFETLKRQGIEFFTGVPDTLLKDFCECIDDYVDEGKHIIAANEGNAIGLAAGWYMGTRKPALVYMQNSGLGNSINPLLSLADREVYGIPMLILIGWRGAPGTEDEPQHVKQGRVTQKMLSTLEIPSFVLDAEVTDLDKLISDSVESMLTGMTPVAILIGADVFSHIRPVKAATEDYPLSREEALKLIVDCLDPRDLVVSTTGKISRELYEYRKSRSGTGCREFLTVGSMGHASSIAMGLSMAMPKRRVLCLDGDGSVIMHMGSMAVIGQKATWNLIHIVLNNGSHDSVGGQPTVGFGIDLTEIAAACGYKRVASVSEAEEIVKAMKGIQDADGPSFIEVRVKRGAREDLGRPKTRPMENRKAFMETCRLDE